MSITDPRERDREKIKQLILTVAADIISQEGLEKLSVRKIAVRI